MKLSNSGPRGRRVLVFALVGSLAAIGLLATGDSDAASIPAWLDEAITDWNEENQAIQIQFVDIKDSYVWYQIPRTAEIKGKDIRTSIYDMVREHGYKVTDDEERVTTGKPPSQTPSQAKKCWTRSFVLDIENLSNTTSAGRGGRHGDTGMRQRMLTSLVCEDSPNWYTGFRILQ